ncbi:MAG: nucleoside triphosphate pyrophosphohydrolase [Calditrichaceae bacterium]|nr:nucleoside triphosphate pyrophosphohydrolase [Calditrichaceae bacterium]HES60266.1 nucleoside triphosphate pyrophosphohydrolase [Caldithrix sp.]
MQRTGQKYNIDELLEIMKRLRDECPWDAKQTHHTLKQYLLEEAYEVLETIDSESWSALSSELGDLLLQIIFHSEIASGAGEFDFTDVIDGIAEKLVHRHPHVFADTQVNSANEVQDNWEHNKLIKENRKSILAGIPKSAPALLQAQRLQQKAATVGFDWTEINPVIDKIEEEWQEFKQALKDNNQTEIKKEFGDLLFSMVNLARFCKILAEDALRLTNQKFIRRFQYIEKQYKNNPKLMKEQSLDTLDQHWNDAKNLEND